MLLLCCGTPTLGSVKTKKGAASPAAVDVADAG
jgi:hypothetical protein